MWHTIAILGGFIGAMIFLFLMLASLDDNAYVLGFTFLLLLLTCGIICTYGMVTIYEERIETVTVISTFTDFDHTPTSGFLSDKDIEYRYSQNFVFHKNQTYKIKSQHNNDNGFNIILYQYT